MARKDQSIIRVITHVFWFVACTTDTDRKPVTSVKIEAHRHSERSSVSRSGGHVKVCNQSITALAMFEPWRHNEKISSLYSAKCSWVYIGGENSRKNFNASSPIKSDWNKPSVREAGHFGVWKDVVKTLPFSMLELSASHLCLLKVARYRKTSNTCFSSWVTWAAISSASLLMSPSITLKAAVAAISAQKFPTIVHRSSKSLADSKSRLLLTFCTWKRSLFQISASCTTRSPLGSLWRKWRRNPEETRDTALHTYCASVTKMVFFGGSCLKAVFAAVKIAKSSPLATVWSPYTIPRAITRKQGNLGSGPYAKFADSLLMRSDSATSCTTDHDPILASVHVGWIAPPSVKKNSRCHKKFVPHQEWLEVWQPWCRP